MHPRCLLLLSLLFASPMGLSVSRNTTLVFVFDKRGRHQNSDIVSEDSKGKKDEEVKDGEIFVSKNKPSVARS